MGTLLLLFYMHLREEHGLVRLVTVSAGAWLMVMLVSSDDLTRFWFKVVP